MCHPVGRTGTGNPAYQYFPSPGLGQASRLASTGESSTEWSDQRRRLAREGSCWNNPHLPGWSFRGFYLPNRHSIDNTWWRDGGRRHTRYDTAFRCRRFRGRRARLDVLPSGRLACLTTRHGKTGRCYATLTCGQMRVSLLLQPKQNLCELEFWLRIDRTSSWWLMVHDDHWWLMDCYLPNLHQPCLPRPRRKFYLQWSGHRWQRSCPIRHPPTRCQWRVLCIWPLAELLELGSCSNKVFLNKMNPEYWILFDNLTGGRCHVSCTGHGHWSDL